MRWNDNVRHDDLSTLWPQQEDESTGTGRFYAGGVREREVSWGYILVGVSHAAWGVLHGASGARGLDARKFPKFYARIDASPGVDAAWHPSPTCGSASLLIGRGRHTRAAQAPSPQRSCDSWSSTSLALPAAQAAARTHVVTTASRLLIMPDRIPPAFTPSSTANGTLPVRKAEGPLYDSSQAPWACWYLACAVIVTHTTKVVQYTKETKRQRWWPAYRTRGISYSHSKLRWTSALMRCWSAKLRYPKAKRLDLA